VSFSILHEAIPELISRASFATHHASQNPIRQEIPSSVPAESKSCRQILKLFHAYTGIGSQ
jgi:hypothetical protein